MLVLIWIQSVRHTDGIPKKIFRKKLILKKVSRRQQKHEQLTNMQRANRYSSHFMNGSSEDPTQPGFKKKLFSYNSLEHEICKLYNYQKMQTNETILLLRAAGNVNFMLI